jgi:hypothetical protein
MKGISSLINEPAVALFGHASLIMSNLRTMAQVDFRLRTYEPDGWRPKRMRLLINNLGPIGTCKTCLGINDWPSYNQSWPEPKVVYVILSSTE